MIQIMVFFISPLLGTLILERICNKNFSYKQSALYYASIFMITNILCLAAIALVSKNGGFTLGNSDAYSTQFIFKYLLSSLLISCVIIPIVYKLWPDRQTIYANTYAKIENFLIHKKSSVAEYLRKNKASFMMVAVSFAIFMFLMCYKLMNSALWGDELVEHNISMLAIKDGSMYKSVIGTYQPPLYNWVAHFWLKINSESLLWFRLLNILLGVISGVYLYKTQLAVFKSKILGCASLLTLGICYRWIYVVQECSEYTLMLTFLFATIYYYSQYKNTNHLRYELLFIFGCIGAMYSQYGAAFIVGPLLIIHFIDKLRSDASVMRQLRTCIIYIVCLFAFALPLYSKYLKIQLMNNKIAQYANSSIGIADTKGIATQFGLNVAWLWNVNNFEIIKIILSWIWIPFFAALLFVAAKRHKGSSLLPLSLTLLLGYVAHYFLVVMHIYAMVHANKSSGFFSRYSYFYIPVLAFIIPGGIYAIVNAALPKGNTIKCISASVVLASAFVICWPAIDTNWHKAYDDIYASLWMENKGYDETTYLTGGCCFDAFEWYVEKEYGYEYGDDVHNANDIDYKKLPKNFWVWKTNWSTEKYDEIMEKAKAKGYSAEIYDEHGLVRFSKNTSKKK